jgi:hypothetical protein
MAALFRGGEPNHPEFKRKKVLFDQEYQVIFQPNGPVIRVSDKHAAISV